MWLSLKGLEQAAAHIVSPDLRLEPHGSTTFLKDTHNLAPLLLVRVNLIIFPIVLSHQFRVWIQTAPVIFGVGKDAFNILIMLTRTSLVLFHSIVSGLLLSEDLLDRLWIENNAEVRSRSCITGLNSGLLPRSAGLTLSFEVVAIVQSWHARRLKTRETLALCGLHGCLCLECNVQTRRYPGLLASAIGLHCIVHFVYLWIWWGFLNCLLKVLDLDY